MFNWLREHQRNKLREEPFPQEWLDALAENFPVYARLTPEEQDKLRGDVRVFLHEKSWEGCGGMELTDTMRVLISAQAMLLLLHREHDYYPNVESILVYPTGYRAADKARDPSGVVNAGGTDRLGEAWSNGPVVLSGFDAILGGSNPNDGSNVVYHELAHKLDMSDGEMNGVPLLENDAEVEEWAEVMSAEYEALVAAAEHGHHTLLNTYGATNAAEFFAVATECFFEKSVQMQHTHPKLYHALQGYYHQDPAARHEPETENGA